MTTAIVYASKYGSTAEIARRVADGLGPGTTLFDLAKGKPDVGEFDTVILGTPVYAGTPISVMKTFTRAADMTGKRLALFVGGMEADPIKRQTEIQAAFPPELLSQAVAVAFCGGRFQFAAMNAAERFLIRRISKTKTDVDAIDDDAIAAFIATLKASRPMVQCDNRLLGGRPATRKEAHR